MRKANVTITMTPEELQRLRVAAAMAGQSVSAFVRHCVMPIVAKIENPLQEEKGGHMKRFKLVNAAMMPTAGLVYRPERIDREEFVRVLQNAQREGHLESFIGYQTTAEHIERISGVAIPVNRGQTTVAVDDTLLVCKLAYRLADPNTKRDATAQASINEDDYEYWIVHVSG